MSKQKGWGKFCLTWSHKMASIYFVAGRKGPCHFKTNVRSNASLRKNVTMDNKMLPQWQKDEILQLLSNRGLDPSAFEWKEIPSVVDSGITISRLVHPVTGYYFSFDFLNGLHYVERRPGTHSGTDTRYPGSWEHQLKYFFEWLNFFKTP